MKNLWLMFILLMVSSNCYAVDCADKVGGCPPVPVSSQSSETNYRPAVEAGVGMDIKVYEFKESEKWYEPRHINIELRKDFVDIDRFSGYVVGVWDLTK